MNVCVSLSRRLQKRRLLLRALKSRVSRLFVENASVFDRQNTNNLHLLLLLLYYIA